MSSRLDLHCFVNGLLATKLRATTEYKLCGVNGVRIHIFVDFHAHNKPIKKSLYRNCDSRKKMLTPSKLFVLHGKIIRFDRHVRCEID